MNAVRTALAGEWRKARASRVLRSTSLILCVGVCALAGGGVLAARGGDAQIIAKLGPMAQQGGWTALLSGAAQVTAAGSILAFGVGLSWLVGREFGDGTAPGLFGLPVSRSAIALGKVAAYLAWSSLVAIALTGALTITGLATGLGWPTWADTGGLGRQLALGLFSALLAVPCGAAATLGRGVLPGIAVAVGTLVVAQVSVIAGAGAWFPLVAPALWSIDQSAVPAAALAASLTVPLVGALLMVLGWRRLQLDH